jgi:hypothetical protein
MVDCEIGDEFNQEITAGERVRLKVWVNVGEGDDIPLEAEFECERSQGSTVPNPFLDFT